MNYADVWADAINETYGWAYTDDADDYATATCVSDEDVLRILTKAAQCLRNGVPATFTGDELDLVRHMMPAHEVHQSGAVAWVGENYGTWTEA